MKYAIRVVAKHALINAAFAAAATVIIDAIKLAGASK